MKLSANKILITGGASGIGFALAERFVQLGNQVIICGRRQDALDEAARKIPSLITCVADLSNERGRMDLFNRIQSGHPDLNVLVNNAGIQQWIQIGNDDFYQRAKDEIAINIEAPVHLCQLFVQMKALNTVMNVSSGLAFGPLAKVPVYSATKAFMHSFTLTLRHVLRSKNISVVEIIPPALNTDLGGKGLHDAAPPVSEFIDAIFKQLEAGADQLTFGFSDHMAKACPEELKAAFARMNP